MSKFKILESNKVGLNSKEGYVVTRDDISFLRILGSQPELELMTATASEDCTPIRVCTDQLRLIETSLLLGAENNTALKIDVDWKGREYVKICTIKGDLNEDDGLLNKELKNLINRFFEIYDNYKTIELRSNGEMLVLYNELTVDDHGGDVYLSDGIWLSKDGSLHERVR
ncbi:hypothetical protein [Shewanella marina]|uniref:hypothetical protein n=1 Tax=Shewanella marina TaxID=487319 RepID=UPI00056A0EF3|nr:hypothetical protein [Shewanella marina]